MEKIDKRIIEFINGHHVLTLATSNGNQSWCANCFYVYLENLNALVFTSDEDTRHVKEVKENNKVSGSIVLETNVVGKIQGIQFMGEMLVPDKESMKLAKKSYLKRFPYAALMKTTLWMVQLNYIKLTDNRLGFGKKLIWEK